MAGPAPQSPPPARPGSRLRAWLQLLRLPNVFTAMADVLLGYFVVFDPGASPPWDGLALLLGASSCLYLAGMVLNDVFDLKVDTEERPERPLPSGRIAPGLARLLGFELLLVGTALGWTASYLLDEWRAGGVATALAVMVLLYDVVLKKTPLAPAAMGGCRMLNVLLGMSLATVPLERPHYVIAAGVGIYIAGVTWFARTEARRSHRGHLGVAALVMALGIFGLASLPHWAAGTSLELFPNILPRWYWLMSLLGAMILWRCGRAVADPTPRLVQQAVKHSILSLIMLDAATCVAVRGFGTEGGQLAPVAILALLVPTIVLGRWVYST